MKHNKLIQNDLEKITGIVLNEELMFHDISIMGNHTVVSHRYVDNNELKNVLKTIVIDIEFGTPVHFMFAKAKKAHKNLIHSKIHHLTIASYIMASTGITDYISIYNKLIEIYKKYDVE